MDHLHAEAVYFIKSKASDGYEVGIILGTGLGGLVKFIKQDLYIEYKDVPNCPVSTVESHFGKMIFGTLAGKRVITMQGRFHFYEGYSHRRITFPIQIMKSLGIKYLIVSNACGALNQKFQKTDLMIITSHLNLHFTSPLIGVKYFNEKNGPDHIYSKKLINLAENIALENNIGIRKGVYATVQGPNLETRAEYRMIRKFGADVIGMSTIPEAIVAHKLGIEVLGLSIITDEGFPNTLKVAQLSEILESASIAEPYLTNLTEKLVERL